MAGELRQRNGRVGPVLRAYNDGDPAKRRRTADDGIQVLSRLFSVCAWPESLEGILPGRCFTTPALRGFSMTPGKRKCSPSLAPSRQGREDIMNDYKYFLRGCAHPV